MSDSNAPTTSASLPPPPQAPAAPGQADYSPPSNGSTSQSHMPPPPLQPVVIPQNNSNPVQGSISSPFSGSNSGGVMTPTSGGSVRRAAPEPNKRALYVGGLDPRVDEGVLRQIFETAGHVQSTKIIPDKNNKGFNYGFVEYDDPGAAERAMQNLNGRRVHQSEIKVNWAYQSNTTNREDTSNHFHIFVGDLSNEVNDDILLQAFSAFGTISEARVMWDMKTGRSRGYGFVAFRDRADAEKALSSMDGEWLGSRQIRCNWANQKGQPSISQQQAMAAMGMTPTTPFSGHHHFPTNGMQRYDMVNSQTPSWQTTCYVGNLTPYTTQNDIVPLFNNFGYVIETRFQADRGFAFIKMDTHENAAAAICNLNGYQVNGRPLKCSWGKDRPPTGTFDQFAQGGAQSPGFGQGQGFGFPQYSNSPISPQGPQGGAMGGFGGAPSPGGRGFSPQGQGAYPNNFGPGNFGGMQMPGNSGNFPQDQQGSGNWNQQQQQPQQQQQGQQQGQQPQSGGGQRF